MLFCFNSAPSLFQPMPPFTKFCQTSVLDSRLSLVICESNMPAARTVLLCSVTLISRTVDGKKENSQLSHLLSNFIHYVCMLIFISCSHYPSFVSQFPLHCLNYMYELSFINIYKILVHAQWQITVMSTHFLFRFR